MKKEIKIAYFPSIAPKSQVLTSNGITLDNYCTKCETEENLNTGGYTLDASFLLEVQQYLEEENILKVKMDYGDEVFRISKVTKGTRYIDIVARQITIAETLSLYLSDASLTNISGQAAMSYLSSNSTGIKEITFTSDITNIGTAYYEDMSLYKALQDSDNSFIKIWGGEVLRRAYNVAINASAGIDRCATIREGKNLTGFNGTSNIDSLVTRARGKGFNGITGNWIDSPLINNYARVYTKSIEYQDVKVKGDSDTEGYATEALAKAELDRRIALEYSKNDIDKIKATYEINFVQLEKTEEYKNYTIAERVFLGDTLRVYIPKLDTDIKVRAVVKKYDVLAQKTKELTLSNAVQIQSMSMNDIISDLRKQYQTSSNNSIAQYIDSIIKSGMKDSYAVIRDNEILVMNTKDINTATTVARFNKNGLGFSSAGYYGTYEYGFTLDGVINASLIQTGILSAIKIQSLDGNNYFDLGTGKIKFKTGKIEGSNSSWDLDTGVFTSNQPDGSQIIISPTDGFYNYFAGSRRGYYHLNYNTKIYLILTTTTDSLGVISNAIATASVSLPDEYKNKSFNVSCRIGNIEPVSGSGTWLVQNQDVWVTNKNLTDATFTVNINFKGVLIGWLVESGKSYLVSATGTISKQVQIEINVTA